MCGTRLPGGRPPEPGHGRGARAGRRSPAAALAGAMALALVLALAPPRATARAEPAPPHAGPPPAALTYATAAHGAPAHAATHATPPQAAARPPAGPAPTVLAHPAPLPRTRPYAAPAHADHPPGGPAPGTDAWGGTAAARPYALATTSRPTRPARAARATTAPASGLGRPAGRGEAPAPLERLFDNVGVSDDARPGAADLDGAGHSLSARDLAAAGWSPGAVLTLDATRLTWPRSVPGSPDNVRADGQTVALTGRGDALTFLVTGSTPGSAGPGAGGVGTVRYRDGSHQRYDLTAPDWRGGSLATRALALPHLNSPTGQRAEPALLYAVSVPLTPGEEVAAVILPTDPGPGADLHVFALAVRQTATEWSGTWAASTSGLPPVRPGEEPGGGWRNRTLRLVVHTSLGGPRARIRLANTFAATPVDVAHASLAVREAGATAAAEPVPLTFDGRPEARIAAGAQVFSDPVDLAVPPEADLLVSLHLPGAVTAAPVHAQANQRSYLSPADSGDHTGDRVGPAFTASLTTWPYLTGVDVAGGPGSVVALGDSITDGERSTPGANRRWPDVLARRLLGRPTGPRYGVLGHGIAANRVVTDRYPGDGVSADVGGVSAQHRLERDVLAQTGVRAVIVFEGVNDVRSGTTTDAVTAGLRAIADRAHGRGLRVLAATLAPCEGFADCTPAVDARREAVNAFVRRHRGTFDAVLDFDAVLRDPDRPRRLLPGYDSGDHLHPNEAGLRALGDSVDLRLLSP
ncbi:GDSL-type esterase/lipase family protein [Streptomyces sp. NPDC057702]|uniref:GDSL-type esterase/lipase family protein n=1 Tax=unclassified Streptomyces TaxID=2593676 RepID=UPI0036ACF6E8